MIDDLFNRLPTVEEVTYEIYDTASRSRLLRSLRRLLVAIEETRSRDLEDATQDCHMTRGSDARLIRSQECNAYSTTGDRDGGEQ
jgi:hypothetical protein